MKISEKLLLAQPVKEDLRRFYEIHSDPQTNLFNPSGPMNAATAEKAFIEIMEHWQMHSFGVWAVKEMNNPQAIIGFGGLSYRLYKNDLKLNIGYRFDKNYWGKGYATESAQRTINFGLNELNKDELFAVVRPAHTASIKVLEKCNMKLSYLLNDVPGEEPSLVYKISMNTSKDFI